MKKLFLALILLAITCSVNAQRVAVLARPDGSLITPTNFFGANAAAITAVVGSVATNGLAGTNLIYTIIPGSSVTIATNGWELTINFVNPTNMYSLTLTGSAWAPLTVNTNWLVVTNGKVGVGTNVPSTALEVSGTVKATTFVGDGSGLTGITGGTGAPLDGTNTWTGTNSFPAFGIDIGTYKIWDDAKWIYTDALGFYLLGEVDANAFYYNQSKTTNNGMIVGMYGGYMMPTNTITFGTTFSGTNTFTGPVTVNGGTNLFDWANVQTNKVATTNFVQTFFDDSVYGLTNGVGIKMTTNGTTIAISRDTSSFGIAVIGDMQNLMYYTSADMTNRFNAMCNWINTNNEIKVAVGLGDLVYDISVSENWPRAKYGYSLITNKPVLLTSGNHDIDSYAQRDHTTFNTYFDRAFFTNNPYFSGGFYDSTNQQNAYCLVTNNNYKLLIITLQYAPFTNQVVWASNICATYPDHIAFIATHSYQNLSGERTRYGDLYSSSTYALTNAADGANIWDLLKNSPNIGFIASGHQISSPGEVLRVDQGEKNNLVNQFVFNYQSFGYTNFWPTVTNSGPVAFVKYLQFTDSDKVTARTYDAEYSRYWTQYDYTMSLGNGPSIDIQRSVVNSDPKDSLVFYAPLDELILDSSSGLVQTNFMDISINRVRSGNIDPPTQPVIMVNESNSVKGFSIIGNTNRIRWTPEGMLGLTNKFSASVWYKPFVHTNGGPEIFLSWHSGTTNGVFYLGRNLAANKLRYMATAGATRVDLDVATLPTTNIWHHLAITYDGTNVLGYLNGQIVCSNALSGNIYYEKTIPIQIAGYGGYVGDAYYPAASGLDEAKIWGRCLTPYEVMQEATIGKRPAFLTTANTFTTTNSMPELQAGTLRLTNNITRTLVWLDATDSGSNYVLSADVPRYFINMITNVNILSCTNRVSTTNEQKDIQVTLRNMSGYNLTNTCPAEWQMGKTQTVISNNTTAVMALSNWGPDVTNVVFGIATKQY